MRHAEDAVAPHAEGVVVRHAESVVVQHAGPIGAPKIIFADHLRGVAALLVVVSHLVVLYWTRPEVVAAYSLAPPGGAAHGAVWPPATFDLGAFGVGLFFLISGFVIPMSLERLTGSAFLVARVFRIWPTYLAALGFDLAVQYASSCYWHTWFHPAMQDILANALLLPVVADWVSLDSVNWTLAIEIQFYLAMAIAYPAILALRERAVLYAACILPAMLVVRVLMPSVPLGLPAIRSAACLAFMLVGTLVYLHMQGRVTRRAMLCVGGVAVTAITLGLARCIGPAVPTGFAVASAVFVTLFLLRDRIGHNRALSALSAISYPLYLLHPVLGYAILQAMRLGLGASYPAALAVAAIAVLAMAILLHVALERPSMALGKRMSARMSARMTARSREAAEVRRRDIVAAESKA